MAERNPFRHPLMRAQFDRCISDYEAGKYGSADQPYRGNGLADEFWRGFKGCPTLAAKVSASYAAYRAGQACAA